MVYGRLACCTSADPPLSSFCRFRPRPHSRKNKLLLYTASAISASGTPLGSYRLYAPLTRAPPCHPLTPYTLLHRQQRLHTPTPCILGPILEACRVELCSPPFTASTCCEGFAAPPPAGAAGIAQSSESGPGRLRVSDIGPGLAVAITPQPRETTHLLEECVR